MHKIAPDLNAYTLNFAEDLLNEIRASYYRDLSGFLLNPANGYLFEGGRTHRQAITGQAYYLYSYENYPLLWVSNNSERTYQLFQRLFEDLELQQKFHDLIDYRQGMVMYCGFFVLGNRAPEPLWHYDYLPGANAYTLITPLFEPSPGHGHLLYKNAQDEEQRYQYELNQALIFGPGFLHSTEPYPISPKYRVLASLTFGSDKADYWPITKKAITAQSKYYCLPCGHKAGTCTCFGKDPRQNRFRNRLKDLRDFFKASSS